MFFLLAKHVRFYGSLTGSLFFSLFRTIGSCDKSLRLPYTFRSAIFNEFRFFGLSGPETEEQIKLTKDKFRFDLYL